MVSESGFFPFCSGVEAVVFGGSADSRLGVEEALAPFAHLLGVNAPRAKYQASAVQHQNHRISHS